jgi:S1-C subfamily serine protease
MESSRAWTCPACKRLVPGGVTVCRCGESRPVLVDEPGEFEGERPRSPWQAGIGLAVVAIVAGAGIYWYTHRAHRDSGAPPAANAPVDAGQRPTEIARAAATPATPPLPPPDPPAAPPPPDKDPAKPDSLEDMIAGAAPAVVLIETDSSRGTGFFVRSDLLVSNAHVVRGSTTVRLRFADGRSGAASVVSMADGVDLALLRPAPGSAAPAILELSSVRGVRPGQEVVAIGSALGVLQNTVTRGIVSAIRQDRGVRLLQTDAAINPGNSGGPLLDRMGKVVGVNTMKAGGSAASIGFAVAADHVLTLIETPRGTMPNLPGDAGGPALPGLPPQSAPPDQRHERAVGAHTDQLKAVAARADAIDEYWERFRKSCNATKPGRGGDREWFGVWSHRPDIQSLNPSCTVWLNDIIQLGTSVKKMMADADEAARRTGVYPGEARDLRRKFRLEWDAWDR